MTKADEQPTANHTVELLAADEAAFSDLGASIETDFTSLSSSIRDHVYENGRRYHSLNAGTYSIPNDENEQERMDMMHHATSLILDGALHVVKLPKKLDRILDLGTGTGIWAIDMADQHPKAHVIGVDLSPIQSSWVPPNCSFEVDDLEKPWLWKEKFDFIHSANLAQGIRDWTTYTQRIYDNLTPGGVVQLFESRTLFETDDDSIPKSGDAAKYQETFDKAVRLADLPEDVGPNLQTYLQQAGFVDIKVVVKKLPIGPWPRDRKKKELGRWGLAIIEQGLKSYGYALFTRMLGMSLEEATALCDAAYKEFGRRDVHTYFAQWFVEGRKPDEGEVHVRV